MTVNTNTIKKFLSTLERAADRINIFHVLFLSLLLVVLSIVYHGSGAVHQEINTYLPYYLSNRPLLSKIFNSKVLDLNQYQARELSYFFDYIDCKFISLSVSLGVPHFFSLTVYVFSVLIGLVLWQFSVRELNLKPWIGVSLVLLFWTSPSVFLGGTYFRSAKIGVALTAVLLYLLIFRVLQADRQRTGYSLSKASWLACFGIAWAATLFDLQGVFMIGVMIVFLTIWAIAYPGKNIFLLLSAFVASFGLSVFYDHRIGLWLTIYFNHYRPDFDYQLLPWEKLLSNPVYYINAGVGLFVDTLRFLIGDLPANVIVWFIAPLSLALLIIYGVISYKRKETRLFFVVAIGLIIIPIVLICGMNSVMVLRHPPILWPDVRIVYYWVPTVSILCMTFAFVLSRLIKVKLIPGWAILILLVVAIVGNVHALPQHLLIVANGSSKYPIEIAPKLIAALKNLKNAQYQVPPDIEQNPIYQFFKSTLTQ